MFAVLLMLTMSNEFMAVMHVSGNRLDAERWAVENDHIIPDGMYAVVGEVGVPEWLVDNEPICGVTVNGSVTTRQEW